MAYDADLSFIYRNYTRIVFGANTVNDVGSEVDYLKCSKAFVITDKGVEAAGLAEKVRNALGNRLVGTFDEVPQDSGYHIVAQAAEMISLVQDPLERHLYVEELSRKSGLPLAQLENRLTRPKAKKEEAGGAKPRLPNFSV